MTALFPRRGLRAWLCGLLLLVLGPLAWAQGLLPLPELSARMIDQTGTLSAADQSALEQRLRRFEEARGTQIVVLLVPTTAPEDIADYTQRLGDAWKIGRQEVGDGLLFVVALNDRRMRIAPAKTLEGAIPDVIARRILDQVVAPAFRQGQVAAGIHAGLDHLEARIVGEELPLPQAQPQADGPSKLLRWIGAFWVELAMLLLVAVPVVAEMLSRWFGQRLAALGASGLAGFLAWRMSGLLWLGIVAGLLGLISTLFLQNLPRSRRGRARGGRDTDGPDTWGTGHGGGWGGGGFSTGGGDLGGGGISSGGGGDFGGGGASGEW